MGRLSASVAMVTGALLAATATVAERAFATDLAGAGRHDQRAAAASTSADGSGDARDRDGDTSDPAAAIAETGGRSADEVVPDADPADNRAEDDGLAAEERETPEPEVLTLDPGEMSDTAGEETEGAGQQAASAEDRPAKADEERGGEQDAEQGRERDATRPDTDTARDDPPSGDRIDLSRRVTSIADLIGSPVHDGDGNRTGEIADLLMSLETGMVETVVIADDAGFLGLGEEDTRRVSIDRVAIDPLGGEVILDGADGDDGDDDAGGESGGGERE